MMSVTKSKTTPLKERALAYGCKQAGSFEPYLAAMVDEFSIIRDLTAIRSSKFTLGEAISFLKVTLSFNLIASSRKHRADGKIEFNALYDRLFDDGKRFTNTTAKLFEERSYDPDYKLVPREKNLRWALCTNYVYGVAPEDGNTSITVNPSMAGYPVDTGSWKVLVGCNSRNQWDLLLRMFKALGLVR